MAATATVVNTSASQNANTIEAIRTAITASIGAPGNGEIALVYNQGGRHLWTFVTGEGWNPT